MSELKRCPICGGEAEIERIGTMKQSMIIACTNCGCRVESGDMQGLTKPESYKWNMRVRDADNTQLREALEKIRDNPDALESMGEIYDIANKALREVSDGNKD